MISRRSFVRESAGVSAFLGAAAAAPPPQSAPNNGPSRRRIGAVAYSYQYSIGLFGYSQRPGERMDPVKFVEATHRAGGNAAQLYTTMVVGLDAGQVKRLRNRAADLDVHLEIHGGVALEQGYERVLPVAEALGVKMVGCSFGMLNRPSPFATLAAWDGHIEMCTARLRELVGKARAHDIVIGVEDHLDLTLEEMVDLMKHADSPNAGVIFDVGNWIGTLDDPLDAADALGPYVVGTHYKDFAIEEVTRGFRFTMVPLGAGSLRLPEITARLEKHVRPQAAYCIEMMNGQQFEVPWLSENFWVPFRNKSAGQVAATLRHIRGKAIAIDDFRPQIEIDKLSYEQHVKLEDSRITRCIAALRQLLAAEHARA